MGFFVTFYYHKMVYWVAYIMWRDHNVDVLMWCWMHVRPSSPSHSRLTSFPSPFSSHSMSTMAIHPWDPEEASEKPHTPLQIGFVHVGGRYRVGKLLGSGGSGEPNSASSSPLYWYFPRECLPRERYQDGSQGCFEDREPRPVAFRAQSWIQCVYKYCWQHRYLFCTLVWQRRPIWSHCLGASWQVTWRFDQQGSDW